MQLFILSLLCKGFNLSCSKQLLNDVKALNEATDFFMPNKMPNSTSIYTIFDTYYVQLAKVSKKSITIEAKYLLTVHEKLVNDLVDINVFRWFLRLYYTYLQEKSTNKHACTNMGSEIMNSDNDVTINYILCVLSKTEAERNLLMQFVKLLLKEVNDNLKNAKPEGQMTQELVTNYQLYLEVIHLYLTMLHRAINEIDTSNNAINMNQLSLLLIPINRQISNSESPEIECIYVDSLRNEIGNNNNQPTCNANQSRKIPIYFEPNNSVICMDQKATAETPPYSLNITNIKVSQNPAIDENSCSLENNDCTNECTEIKQICGSAYPNSFPGNIRQTQKTQNAGELGTKLQRFASPPPMPIKSNRAMSHPEIVKPNASKQQRVASSPPMPIQSNQAISHPEIVKPKASKQIRVASSQPMPIQSNQAMSDSERNQRKQSRQQRFDTPLAAQGQSNPFVFTPEIDSPIPNKQQRSAEFVANRENTENAPQVANKKTKNTGLRLTVSEGVNTNTPQIKSFLSPKAWELDTNEFLSDSSDEEEWSQNSDDTVRINEILSLRREASPKTSRGNEDEEQLPIDNPLPDQATV